MQLGIDWVSTGVLVLAFVFVQIRSVPIRARYAVVAACCGGIAVYRMSTGAAGPNLLFVGLAAVLALYYAVRALRGR